MKEKRHILFLILMLLFHSKAFSKCTSLDFGEHYFLITFQSEITLSGTIKGNDTPLSYATIGIEGKNVGTLADERGYFELKIRDEYFSDSLTVRYLGYDHQKFKISELESHNLNINLNKSEVVLEEVVVDASKTRKFYLGNKSERTRTYGYMFGGGVGTEIGQLMEIKNKTIYLEKVSIYISQLGGKGFKLLLKIYSQDKLSGLPDESALVVQRLITSRKSEGWIDIDLSDENIFFSENFYVCFQWISEDIKSPLIGLKGDMGLVRTKALGRWKFTKSYPWMIRAQGIFID